jgi:hypothetical protein
LFSSRLPLDIHAVSVAEYVVEWILQPEREGDANAKKERVAT